MWTGNERKSEELKLIFSTMEIKMGAVIDQYVKQ